VVLGITAWGVHLRTQDSYRKVGVEDGKIDQKMQFIADLKKSKALPSCEGIKEADLSPFLDVKATTLYIVRTEGSDFRFCITE